MLFTNIKTIDANMIKILIDQSKNRHDEIKKLYERYKGTKDGVPILTRSYIINGVEQKDKINNKVSNDFFGEIIDTKVGFFCGVPITYNLDKETYGTAYDDDMELINDFNDLNSIEDIDAETAKRAAIGGYCGRLMYLSQEDGAAVVRLMVLDPWECIFIGQSIDEPDYSIRYYDVDSYDANGEKKTTTHAELYDSTLVKYFVKNDAGNFVPEKPDYAHQLFYNPLIGFANNDEMQGDAEKVLPLIDGYDRTVSDVNSELEQFRLSYMYTIGMMVDDATLAKCRQTGNFSLPDKECEIGFIEKNINDAVIEHHLERLEANIYRFSKTPSMKDMKSNDQLSAAAMKIQFRPFEYKCKTCENKFKKSLRQQYKILCSLWGAQGYDINYLDVEFVFTRNYPQNLLEEADLLMKLKGVVSDKTALSLVSFVQDPEKEIEAIQGDQELDLEMMAKRQEAMGVPKEDENTTSTGAPNA